MKLFETAKDISTPLMLAGIAASAFFLIVRSVILRHDSSNKIITMAVWTMFCLALVTAIFGFFGYLMVPNATVKTPDATLSERLISPVLSSPQQQQGGVGGLVGVNDGGTIENSSSDGTITVNGSNQAVGGLVGRNHGGVIKNSTSTAKVVVTSTPK